MRFPTDPVVVAEREANRAAAFGALARLGDASIGQLATALGVTDVVERGRLRSRLVSWERRGLLRSEWCGLRGMVWAVVEGESA